MTTLQKADKLDAVADWFTDCKTLTLDKLPSGLIEALRDGATALRAIHVGCGEGPVSEASAPTPERSAKDKPSLSPPSDSGSRP